MGATSLANVTGPAGEFFPVVSAACAPNAKASAIPSELTLRAIMFRSFHPYLHIHVRPTAVIPEIPRHLARSIVNDQLQHVLAGLGKRCGCSPVSPGELALGRLKDDLARPAVLLPLHRHSDRLSIAL